MALSSEDTRTLPRAETVKKPFAHRLRRIARGLNPLRLFSSLVSGLRTVIVALIALCALLLFGESADAPRRIDHIVKVSLASDDTAVLLVRTPETGAIRAERLKTQGKVTIYEDVAPEQEAWAEYVGRSLIGIGCQANTGDSLVIHIHSRAEIDLSAQRE